MDNLSTYYNHLQTLNMTFDKNNILHNNILLTNIYCTYEYCHKRARNLERRCFPSHEREVQFIPRYEMLCTYSKQNFLPRDINQIKY